MNDGKPEARVQAALNIHVGKNHAEVPLEPKLKILHDKLRRIRFMMVINGAAIVFFAYWFIGGITQLPDLVFYVLSGVFILNVGVLQFQKKQVQAAIEFLTSRDS